VTALYVMGIGAEVGILSSLLVLVGVGEVFFPLLGGLLKSFWFHIAGHEDGVLL